MAAKQHRLTIVIPALNEEEVIGDTIRRCIAARDEIIENSGVAEVEIVVVSDGSTDGTEAIARRFDEVTTLVFEQNRGYGAAIKAGFAHGRGDLVAFLDADGTCDPRLFAALCAAIDEADADVVLGSRVGSGTRMPALRVVGNWVFARLLGLLSRLPVSDTASGMRVLRRECLSSLYPLPDGLHFTPAMSAAALLAGNVRLHEVPIPYAERVGRSKLSIARDGPRFLRVIVQAAMCYRPARPLLLGSSVLLAVGLAAAVGPVVYYLQQRQLQEWMIYRILLSSLALTGFFLLLSASVVADRIAATAQGRARSAQGVTGLVARLFTRRARWLGGIALLAGALLSAYPGLVQYFTTGQVDVHWSRIVLAALLIVLATQLAIATFLLNMLDLIAERTRPAPEPRPPDRVHNPRAEGA